MRQLERRLGEICRKTAREILEDGENGCEGKDGKSGSVPGQRKVYRAPMNDRDEIGIVRGLAWTSVGGDTLQIEVNLMPGKGEFLLTGQLGDVMKGICPGQASAISVLSADSMGFRKTFSRNTIFISTFRRERCPRTGPSAGITMATAMLSAVTGKPVRADVAMTGEITLRGRCFPSEG